MSTPGRTVHCPRIARTRGTATVPAPIRIHSVTDDGNIRVLVGKSDALRTIEMTDAERLRLISDLAHNMTPEESRR